MHRLGGLVGWFLSLLVVALCFGLGVAVGWFLWGTRPEPRVPIQARGPIDRRLSQVEAADDSRPIDDLIADLVAAPESVTTVDVTDAAMSRARSRGMDEAGRSDARSEARSEAAGSTAETAVIRPAMAATATIPAVRAEPVTEVLPAVQVAEVTEVTEVLPAVQVAEVTEVTEVTEVLPAVQVTEVIPTVVAEAATEPEPASEPEPQPEPEPEPASEPEPEPEPEQEPADDLRRIEGIGPKLATALTAAGITRYAQLAESDPATLGTTLREQGIRFAPNLDTWIAQARLLADGDEEGFTKLAAELVANRRARARR